MSKIILNSKTFKPKNIPNSITNPIDNNNLDDKIYSFTNYKKVLVNIQTEGEYSQKSLSEHNEKETMDNVYKFREEGFVKDTDMPENNIEYSSVSPVNVPIDVSLFYASKIDDVMSDRVNTLNKYMDIYDNEYCSNIYEVGATAVEQTVVSNNVSNTIPVKRLYRVSGDVSELRLFLLLRGLPIEMRKITTSSNGAVFIYPEYLLKSYKDNYGASEGILIQGHVSTNKYYSEDELFDKYSETLDSFEDTAVLKLVEES